ncbi:MAG: hypothetical protein ABIL44_09570, partial [candidate division WOR-3 bacterium]
IYGAVLGGYSNLAGDETRDTAAAVCAGWNNSALSKYAFVGGGSTNIARAIGSTVGSGVYNWADSNYATVGGGYLNKASGYSAVISGGCYNTVSAHYGVIGGGVRDTVKAPYGAILGGYSNLAGDDATDTAAVVVGGYNNTASGKFSFVGAGRDNIAIAEYTTVSGGLSNRAFAQYSTVAGGYGNDAYGPYSFVGGGQYDTAYAMYSGVLSGYLNRAGDNWNDTASVIAGGWNNRTYGDFNAIGGGKNNITYDRASTVAGGLSNIAGNSTGTDGSYSFIGGGQYNIADGFCSVVASGDSNHANGDWSTVGGGLNNFAYGDFSCIPGGSRDTVQAVCGFATNYSTYVASAHTNSAAFTTSHTIAANQVRAASFSTGTVDFAMDYPEDPMNKILNQYAISSDEILSIYTGSAKLDESGRAVVHLPDYFEKINHNPRIQLVGVGTYEVYVAEKIKNNRFVIGGKPNTEVYWEVMAERTDIHAEIARIQTPVVQEKKGELRGHSIDDDAMIGIYDQIHAKNPQLFQFKTEEGRRVNEELKQETENRELKLEDR